MGYARLKHQFFNHKEQQYVSKSKGNFAWNMSIGTTYAIDRNIVLDLSYRFTGYGKVSQDNHTYFDVKKTKQRANELNFGVRYSF